MARLQLALPPLLQALALALILLTLVSPVPSHSSAVALVVVSPAPMERPPGGGGGGSGAAAPAAAASTPHDSAAPQRRAADADDAFGLPVSHVRYKAGLLGDCFTDANQTQQCSRARMQPRFRPDVLARAPGVASDVRALFTTLTYPAPLILTAFLLALPGTALQARRVHGAIAYRVASPLACGPAAGRALLVLRSMCYMQDIAGIVVVVTTLALRVSAAHSIEQFNTDNGARALGAGAFHRRRAGAPMAMHADAGTAFGCLVIAGVVLLAVARVEHRRLRAEAAHTHPHADAVHSARDTDVPACEKERAPWSPLVCEPLAALVRPRRHAISYPLPADKP